MSETRTIKPAWAELSQLSEMSEDTRQENTTDRINASGPGLEILRRVQVRLLRDHMEVLYEHGALGDLVALCAAFDLLERGWKEPASCTRQQATLIEGLLTVLGFEPRLLLRSKLQKRPSWPI